VPADGVIVSFVDGGENVVLGDAVVVYFLDLGGQEVGDAELEDGQ